MKDSSALKVSNVAFTVETEAFSLDFAVRPIWGDRTLHTLSLENGKRPCLAPRRSPATVDHQEASHDRVLLGNIKNMRHRRSQGVVLSVEEERLGGHALSQTDFVP